MIVVADTGAVIALIDSADRHHRVLRAAFEKAPDAWHFPWAILPEVDYLLGAHVSARAQTAFLDDLASSAYTVDWGEEDDLAEAARLVRKHRSLRMGLVDAVVMAISARKRAQAIATLDLRHFGAVALTGSPQLWPRDLLQS